MYKLVLLLALFTTPSFAGRSLPNGTYTTLDAFTPPTIILDGQEYRTSPAIQIRDQHNRILQGTEVPTDVPVWVQPEGRTNVVWRVWILSPDEIAYLTSIGKIKEKKFSLLGLECFFVKCDEPSLIDELVPLLLQ